MSYSKSEFLIFLGKRRFEIRDCFYKFSKAIARYLKIQDS